MRITNVARPLILVLRALPVVVKKGEKGRYSILEPPPFASNFGRVLLCFLSALTPLVSFSSTHFLISVILRCASFFASSNLLYFKQLSLLNPIIKITTHVSTTWSLLSSINKNVFAFSLNRQYTPNLMFEG